MLEEERQSESRGGRWKKKKGEDVGPGLERDA
jgi:hypothetical protein